MKVSVLTLLLALAFSFSNAQAVWTPISNNSTSLKSGKEREIIPEKFSSFVLDFDQMKTALSNAPKIDDQKSNGAILSLPLPNGKMEEFTFHQNATMNPALANKFPMIKSYDGVSNSGKGTFAKIDYGPMGFHASIHTRNGTIYVDPYYMEPDGNYISYYVRDHKVDPSLLRKSCGTTAYREMLEEETSMTHYPVSRNKSSAAEEQVKRKYKLAVTSTGEWGQLFGTKENVMARMVTGINRLNMIFENEVATTFELIARNDELIFLDPETDPFENGFVGGRVLDQNSFVINSIVGSGAYDIGHAFTVSCIDGINGVADLGSICLNNKGNGVSCVGQNNISFFMAGTTAHELGHQFNGLHTFNNCPGAQGQRSSTNAWEPGSGSTILSYGHGVCGQDNTISGGREDYFHAGSVGIFLSFIRTTGACAEEMPSGNHIPEITMGIGDGVVIPIATPFELDASATDEDGDWLVYNWDEMDLGPASSLGQPMGDAPSFRSYAPTVESKRLFPSLPGIIGGIGSRDEVLPLYSRDLTFRFVVRDYHPGAGAITWEQISFRADSSAGPFRVTQPNSLTFAAINESLDVEWDVANTDNDTINCQFVDIYFSTDNGRTFPYILKENTPNDGSESIVLPNELTNEGKIKVKASNNIFFQFNRSNIIVREPDVPGFYIDLAERDHEVCLPNQLEIPIQGTSFQAFDEGVQLDLIDAPEGISYIFSNNPMTPAGNSTLIIQFDGIDTTSRYSFFVEGVAEGADTIRQPLNIRLTGTNYDDLLLQEPASGLQNVRQIPTFRWTDAFNAVDYTLEIATSPQFGNTTVVTEPFIPDTFFTPLVVLDNSELYYWRVLANNECTSVPTEIRTFGTPSLECKDYNSDNLPQNISFSGQVSVDAVVRVFDVGEVADVNVSRISGQHSDVFQLTGTLISPNGTEAVMFDKNCFASTDFNIGFDNDSPTDFVCPLNSGLVVKPNVTDLSVFEGERIDGEWIFRIRDNQSGDGGQFTEFDLELCATFEIDAPYVINNNVLEVPTGLSAKLEDAFLLVGDDNNTDDELIYTLVVSPEVGSIFRDGEAISVGDQFSQADVNNGLVRYIHEGSEDGTDSFVFTVEDGEGGWIDLTSFNIFIDKDVLSSTEEADLTSAFKVYPNPANDRLIIRMLDQVSDYSYAMFDSNGRRVLSGKTNTDEILNLSALNSGIYILQIRNANVLESMRISVMH